MYIIRILEYCCGNLHLMTQREQIELLVGCTSQQYKHYCDTTLDWHFDRQQDNRLKSNSINRSEQAHCPLPLPNRGMLEEEISWVPTIFTIPADHFVPTAIPVHSTDNSRHRGTRDIGQFTAHKDVWDTVSKIDFCIVRQRSYRFQMQ